MTNIFEKLKKLSLKDRLPLFFVISFFSFVLIMGIKVTFAYYNSATPIKIISSVVGDFDSGNGDINILVYKQKGNAYVKNYGQPQIGYVLNTQSVSCTTPCIDNPSSKCNVQCDYNSPSSNCSYVYSNNTITLTSDRKITCKFYYDEEGASDLTVNINIQSGSGYKLSEIIPAYGYEFNNASCDNGATATFVPETRTFRVSTTGATTCNAYFNSVGNSNISAKIYVQNEANGSSYKQVETIPSNIEYELSENVNNTNTCINDENIENIEYTNGFINIQTSSEVTCNVYLDIVTNN